jgi:hypothetical protein
MPAAAPAQSIEVTESALAQIVVENSRTSLDVTVATSPPITVENAELDLLVTLGGGPAPITVETSELQIVATLAGQPPPIVLTTGVGLPGPPGLQVRKVFLVPKGPKVIPVFLAQPVRLVQRGLMAP